MKAIMKTIFKTVSGKKYNVAVIKRSNKVPPNYDPKFRKVSAKELKKVTS